MNGDITRPRSVLVTGGAKRIGRAIAKDLASHGFRVAIHCHGSLGDARSLADEIAAAGGTAQIVVADLTDGPACERLFRETVQRLGPLDLLVNNASVFEDDSALAPDMALFDRHFSIHVKAPIILGACMARQREPADALIVNLIDQRVLALTPRFFSYTLSKSALWTATRTMAQQFAPRIRVNAIGPGPTLPNERQSDSDFEAQTAALPLERGPELAEFGATIRYLLDNRSITGQMIALDGGQHLAWQTPDAAHVKE